MNSFIFRWTITSSILQQLITPLHTAAVSSTSVNIFIYSGTTQKAALYFSPFCATCFTYAGKQDLQVTMGTRICLCFQGREGRPRRGEGGIVGSRPSKKGSTSHATTKTQLKPTAFHFGMGWVLDISTRLILSHTDRVYPHPVGSGSLGLKVYECYIASFDEVWDVSPAAGPESRDLCFFLVR